MPVHRTPALRKSLSAVLLATALALPAVAQGADDLFTVRDVGVDISAGSPNAARDEGVRDAQRKAFDLLFDRLTVDGARTALPPIPSDSIDRMVQSYAVQEERTSATRYVGKLSVRFNAMAVRNLLKSYSVAYAEVRSKPVLILPIDQTGGGPVLWQAQTAWRQAWADLPPPAGLVPIAVPYGEAQDVADIGVEQAMAGDASALRRIAERYSAGDVAVASVAGTLESGLTVTVTLYPASGTAESFVFAQSPLPPPAQAPGSDSKPAATVNPMLQAAVEGIVHRLEERWTAATLISVGAEGSLTLTVQFADQAGWQETRKRLASIPTISQTSVSSLSRHGGVIDLRFNGNLDQLRTALAQRDLLLEQGTDGAILRLAR